MKRSRLKPIGARKLREMKELNLFRLLVFVRAGHKCERCGSKRMLQPHHRIAKSQGGSNEQGNGACLCWHCHRLIHDHAVEDWEKWID